MYEFMHNVRSYWHRLYWALMLVGSSLFVVSYAIQKFVPGLQRFGTSFGLTTTLVTLAIIQVIYSLSLYRAIAKLSSNLATFGSSLLFLLVVLGGTTGTKLDIESFPYLLGWFMTGLFSGMFGLPIVFGSVFLAIAFVLSQSSFDIGQFGQLALPLIIGNSILSVGGYFFWKKSYKDDQSKSFSRLSTMLRSNLQQSEILIQSISDGLIVIDTNGVITLMNPAAAAMTEWPVDEANGMDIRVVVKIQNEHGEDIVHQEDPFVSVLSKSQRINQTVQLIGRNNRKQIISLVVSPILLPKSSTLLGAVAAMRDISEQRAADQQRADFISTAAHEMRTPVAAIEGYLALALNEKISSIDIRARGYLDKAHASTQHLGKLFQDLLASSKAEDGRLSNRPTIVEMSTLLQQLTDELRFTAEKKGLSVEFVIGSPSDNIDTTSEAIAANHMVKPLYYVYVDPDRIREVFTNIFDNACKYTEDGKISIGLTGNVDLVQMYIRDTGHGISAEDIPHLFQKFYRVDSSATRTIGGTGLGLFITRKIIEMYHGRIWVESKVNEGSTFFINLPRVSTPKATELMTASANLQNQPSMVDNSYRDS